MCAARLWAAFLRYVTTGLTKVSLQEQYSMTRNRKRRRNTDWRKTLFLVLSLLMVLTMILAMFLTSSPSILPK